MSRSAAEPLRSLTDEERKELQRVSRASSERRIRHQRAVALLAVAQGNSLSEAARLVGWKSHDPVTKVTRRFNRMGLSALPRSAQVETAPNVWAGSTSPDSPRSPPDARPQGRCDGNLVAHALTTRAACCS